VFHTAEGLAVCRGPDTWRGVPSAEARRAQVWQWRHTRQHTPPLRLPTPRVCRRRGCGATRDRLVAQVWRWLACRTVQSTRSRPVSCIMGSGLARRRPTADVGTGG